MIYCKPSYLNIFLQILISVGVGRTFTFISVNKKQVVMNIHFLENAKPVLVERSIFFNKKVEKI